MRSSRSSSPSPLSEGASWDTLNSRLAALQSPLPGTLGGSEGVLTNPPSAPEGGSSAPSLSKGDSEGRVAVVLVSRPLGVDICGGKVGTDNMRFCSMPCPPGTNSCGRFSSHSVKARVPFPAYFINSTKPGVTYVSPCLPVPAEGFTSSALSSLTGTRSIADWSNVFSVLRNIDRLKSPTQQDILARLDRKIAFEPTPMKSRKRTAVVDMALSLSERGEDEVMVLEDPEDLDQAFLTSEFDAVATQQHMAKNWNGLLRVTQRQRKSGEDMEMSLLGYLEEVDDKVVKVASIVGSEPPLNAPGVTIWDSIQVHNDRLDSVELSVVDAKEKLNRDVSVLNGTINTRVLPVVMQLTTKVEEFSASGFQGNSVIDPFMARQVQQLLDTTQTLVAHGQKMEEEISSLRGEVQTVRNQNMLLRQIIDAMPATMNVQRPAGSDFGIEEMRLTLSAMQDDLAGLRLECDTLRSSVDTSSVSFGGHLFRTTESYRNFVRDHVVHNYYGFCIDFISLMECAMDSDRTTGEGLKTLHMIGRAGYTDTQQARIDTSFGVLIPELFGDAVDKTDPTKKMAMLKTMDDWDYPSSKAGLKSKIDDFIASYRKVLQTQIHITMGNTSVAGLFFSGLIQHTIYFWECFSAWVTKYEREMRFISGVESSDLDKPAVWKLICMMIHAMFTEMAVRRGAGKGIVKLREANDEMVKCASILQGTLGAHQFMEELIDKDFVKHPIFGATMVEFLMGNKASLAMVQSIHTRVKKNEELIRGVQASADKALQAAKKGAAAPK